jgi:molybdopterin-binding protein
MPADMYSVGEAARVLGVSIDTIRRWDRTGKLETRRDASNRRLVPAAEVERLRRPSPHALSARNQLPARVTSVEIDGLMAKVVLETVEPARVVAMVTREAVEDLGLRRGDTARVVLKSTSVMVER